MVEDKDVETEVGEEAGVYVNEKGEEIAADERVGRAPTEQKPLIGRDEGHEEEDEEEGEEAAPEGASDEDREAIRERRRKERQQRKQYRKERDAAKDRLISSLQRQIQDMSTRVAQTEQRQMGVDFARLEKELQDAIQTAEEAKNHLKTAAESNDGTGVADATELYYAARRKAEYLSGIKQQATKAVRQPAAPQLDPELQSHASQWLTQNKWFNLHGQDEDSSITRVIDNQLAMEGYDPRTKEYWEELTDRLATKLPHRFNGKANGRARSPVGGSGRDAAAGNGAAGNGKFYLSAERVRAMKDAGIWDSEEKRSAMIKKYREYDKQMNKGR